MIIIKWFKTLFKIVKLYEQDKIVMAQYIERVKDLTSVNFDIHQRQGSNVVMVGRYRNHDYVEIHTMSDETFSDLVKMFTEYRKQGRIDRIDTAPHIKAVFEREKY